MRLDATVSWSYFMYFFQLCGLALIEISFFFREMIWYEENYDFMDSSHQATKTLQKTHCVKTVRIRSFSGSYFPVFGLHMERHFFQIYKNAYLS